MAHHFCLSGYVRHLTRALSAYCWACSPSGNLAECPIDRPAGVPQSPCSAEAYRHERCLLEGAAFEDAYGLRSEEHTSELQSLMRISYAVFCLKKKKKIISKIKTIQLT